MVCYETQTSDWNINTMLRNFIVNILNCIITAQSDYKTLKSTKELESKDNVVTDTD